MIMLNSFMKCAINQAKLSGEDIPVGCVIVCGNEIISTARNEREKNNDVSAHAEIVALRAAAKKLDNWRLENCSLYVTLEPCPMCAWAILNSRIKEVYFGSYDLKYGAFGSRINLSEISDVKTKVFGGIMENECNDLLKEYFLRLRK